MVALPQTRPRTNGSTRREESGGKLSNGIKIHGVINGKGGNKLKKAALNALDKGEERKP